MTSLGSSDTGPDGDDEMLDLGRFLRDEYPDDAPREPGRAKIVMGGEPVAYSIENTCDACGKTIRSSGVRFGPPMDCPMHPDAEDCLGIHIHYGDNCTALRWRLSRLRTAITWPIERRWKSWRWRRGMDAERADPEAWAHYWSDADDRGEGS